MASAKQILDYERDLKAVGVPEKQAEVHSRKIIEIIHESLVTRDYLSMKLKEVESSIKDETNTIQNDIKDIPLKISELRAEMYKFFIGAMFSMVAMSGVMQTIFHYWK